MTALLEKIVKIHESRRLRPLNDLHGVIEARYGIVVLDDGDFDVLFTDSADNREHPITGSLRRDFALRRLREKYSHQGESGIISFELLDLYGFEAEIRAHALYAALQLIGAVPGSIRVRAHHRRPSTVLTPKKAA